MLSSTPALSAAADEGACKGVDEAYISKHMPLPVFTITAKKDMRGLCEVVIKIDDDLLPIYAQKDKEILIAGDMFYNKKHLTRESLDNQHAAAFRQATADINAAVAFSYKPEDKPKDSADFIYFFTDPDCSYCEQAKGPLRKWADEQKVEIRVILFPLPMHPGSKAKAVSAICSNITYEAYLNNKFGSEACSAGEQKVSKALVLGQGLGIGGTPTFVGPTGKTAVGFDPAELKGIL
jgi:thiol:disulfide interchange protein DsbC